MKKAKGMVAQARQGDVFMFTVSEYKRIFGKLPEKGEEIQPKNGRLIIAEGEATGHYHSLPASDGKLFAVAGVMGMMILEAARKTVLSHQEHGALPVPSGRIVFARQTEETEWGKSLVRD